MNKTSKQVIFHLFKKQQLYMYKTAKTLLFITLKVRNVYRIVILYENFKVISNYLITFLKVIVVITFLQVL